MVRNSSHLEDSDSPDEQLPRLAAEGKLEGAAQDAIRRQRAKGLPITFLRGDQVIRQYPDGREEILGTLASRRDWTPHHTLAVNQG